MKTYIKFILVGLVILFGTGFTAGTNQSGPNNREIKRQKHRIKRALGKAVISWLSDGNDLAAAECERQADSLLALPEPSIRSYFIAAQVANLREKPQKAISILEDVISKYPDKTASYITLPVRIVARFWIGGIARHSGDVAKAKNVYETILTILERPEDIQGLEHKGGVIMICNLYLTEIESLHLKRRDYALAKLEAIERIKKPEGQLGAGYDIYKGWARYQRTKLLKGKAEASRELVYYPEMMSAYLLAATQLLLSPIAGEPLAGSVKGLNIVTEILVNRTIETGASPIDRSLARLGYGFDQLHRGNFSKAEKHFSSLLKEDTYFSPISGIYLAVSKKTQGKTNKADSILEQVGTKYPGYDSAVAGLKESWRKNAPEDKKND